MSQSIVNSLCLTSEYSYIVYEMRVLDLSPFRVSSVPSPSPSANHVAGSNIDNVHWDYTIGYFIDSLVPSPNIVFTSFCAEPQSSFEVWCLDRLSANNFTNVLYSHAISYTIPGPSNSSKCLTAIWKVIKNAINANATPRNSPHTTIAAFTWWRFNIFLFLGPIDHMIFPLFELKDIEQKNMFWTN